MKNKRETTSIGEIDRNEVTDEILVTYLPGFKNHTLQLGNNSLHFVEGGNGKPLLLLPGWPETWWSYRKTALLLSPEYRVIIVDLPGMGSSGRMPGGYDKKSMAAALFEMTRQMGFDKVCIAGHDIGAHVAFGFAANYPEATEKLIMLDTPHPDGSMYRLPMLPLPGMDLEDGSKMSYPWWVAFNQIRDLPSRLLKGRVSVFLDWIFDYLLTDKNAITAFDRAVYTYAYESPGGIEAGNGWYRAFPKDIDDLKSYDRLKMPVLAIGGSGYDMLTEALKPWANDLTSAKIPESGHFIMEEKPSQTALLMRSFLNR